jgi:hypothetical protein
MFVEEVDNPETRATLGTRHRTKPKNTFYTLYTTIPHAQLKSRLKELIQRFVFLPLVYHMLPVSLDFYRRYKNYTVITKNWLTVTK